MSAYTNRIEGFGCDKSLATTCNCPAGHKLKLLTAKTGACGACHRPTCSKQDVLGCKCCNWYICSVCLPLGQDAKDVRGSTFWGSFSQFVEIAKQEIAKVHFKTDTIAAGMSCRNPTQARAADTEIQIEVAPLLRRHIRKQMNATQNYGNDNLLASSALAF